MAVLGIILVYAFVYQWAMATYEGVQLTLVQSVQTVIESLTTAGFAGCSPRCYSRTKRY
ncbi:MULTISPECIES: hypothetical protein [Natrialbaceae]|uniref:hypothetical protein n=1 Tax=Natrialbaceae TaxID=1644061 RepID=UPI00207C8E73|nr:hypothetical protein [Natronococcus sp. CG52]